MHPSQIDRFREVYDTILRHRGEAIPEDRVEYMLCLLGEACGLPRGMIRDDLERTRPAETEPA